MTRDEIEDIKARTPIFDLVRGYMQLIPVGDNYHGACPFCSDPKAFHVSPRHEVFHCFHCHEGGDVFRFLQLHKKVTFAQAVEMLR